MFSLLKSIFARKPLSVFGWLTIASLLGCSAMINTLKISILTDGGPVLFIIAVIVFVCALLVASGLRWLPILGTLISGTVLYEFARQPFVIYHLSQPWHSVMRYCFIVFIIAFAISTFAFSLIALVENYRSVKSRSYPWLKPALSCMAGVVIGALLIGSISQGTPAAANASSGTTLTNGVPTVHMSISSFTQSSVTIPKGSKLLLVDDGNFNHIISNGTWNGAQYQQNREAGAPTINNVQINGNNITLGPFVTAGTYHIFCSLHSGMTLTIVVQ